MIPRRALGAIIVAWAMVTWGSRIGLLSGPESAETAVWIRIVGSLLTAAAAGVAMVVDHRSMRPTAWLYATTAVAIWSSSLVSVWSDSSTTSAFRAVHTGLAVISLALAVASVRAVRQRADTGDRSGSTSEGTAVSS